jgi:flagellar hook-length control protein FliK
MMQQVAAQNTDIAAFGATKVPAIKVKDNASEEFNKVFNDENLSYGKAVSAGSRAAGERQKISQADKVEQEDTLGKVKEGKTTDPIKETAGRDKSDTPSQSAAHSTEGKSSPSESRKALTDSKDQPSAQQGGDSAAADEQSILLGADSVFIDETSSPLNIKPAALGEESASRDKGSDITSLVPPLPSPTDTESELLLPEQQSHNQLMDFISKLQSQEWGKTQTVELSETLALFESTEQKPQIISQSLLNTLLEKLTPPAAASAAGAEGELATAPEMLDDKLLSELMLTLAGDQYRHSPDSPGMEVDASILSSKLEPSHADLELLSILLLPASSEAADSELPLAEDAIAALLPASSEPLDSELVLEEGVITQQLQLNMLADVSKSAAADSQLLAVNRTEAKPELELPQSLRDIPIKAQVEQEVLGPVNKLMDEQPLKFLLKVPENKLDQVLTNLAQRIFDQQAPVEQASSLSTVSSEQDKQLVVADFVSALKAGVDEFKQQLKQGREPGIDLKAMVAEALGKVSELPAEGVKDPLKLEQVSKAFAQVLELGQNIHTALEQQVSAVNIYDRQIKGESNQLHIETAKSQFMQQTQNSQFDKAVNINKPEGHQQLAEKVQWMVNQKNMLAEIRLDPAELGSMSVKVNIQGDAASVSFVVQTQHARDALEQAVPRLREMLAEKGIALGQSSVQQENKNKQDGDGKQSSGQFAAQEEDLHLDEQSAGISQRISNGALGGIDYFV